jgi:RNA polymerase sigma factor (sigma-70 family)
MAKTTASPILHLIRRVAEDQCLKELPDQELLRRFSGGRDEAAFSALLRRHAAMVMDICRNMLGNEADAEDAFQATFLVLARRVGAIRKKSSVGSWLHGVAYRTALKARADFARRQQHEAGGSGPTAAGPSDDLTWREVQQALHAELNQLSECYRAPLVLCYLEGKTQGEAALVLGVSRATVKKRLESARALLRVRLVRRGLGPGAVLVVAAWPAATVSAAVPSILLESTVKAATAIVAGGAATSVVSAKVTALTEGVLKTMFVAKHKIAAAVLVLVSLVGVGVGLFTLLRVTAEQQETEKEEKARTTGNGKNQTNWDKDQLQGSWVVLSALEDGRESVRPKGHRITFEGDHFAIEAGAEMKGSFKLDPSTKPQVMDLKMTEGPEKGQTVKGIYKFQGNDLTICFAKPGATDRPMEFVSKENMARVLLVLRRVADGTSRPQEPPLLSAKLFGQIESQAFKHSQIEEHVFQLTDLRGPRTVGSPALGASQDWLRDHLDKYGLKEVHIEEVPPVRIAPGVKWKPRGWTWTRLVVQQTAPWKTTLVGVPALFSPSTDGIVTGETAIVPWPQTNDTEIMSYMDKHRGKLRGKILMLKEQQEPIQPANRRYSVVELAELEKPGRTAVPESPPTLARPTRYVQASNPPFTFEQWNRIFGFLKKEGVVALLRPAPGEGGTVFLWPPMTPPDVVTSPPPVIDLVPEHYNLLIRLGKRKIPVRLEIELRSQLLDSAGVKNLLADIPGTDKKDELVLVGAHLDSWHCGTGATDNAGNVAVLLESARILSSLKLPLRRTIRFAFWDGHEYGLLGSRGYAEKHLVDPITKKKMPEYATLSCYFNLDYGSGRIRGVYLQGRTALKGTIASWLVKDLDRRPIILSPRTTLGSDQAVFEGLGIPGLTFVQDPLNYEQRTHHTNMDVSDYISVDDLRHSVLVLTQLLYNAAMSEEPLTRRR